MFQDKNILEILMLGGAVIFVLLFCSFFSVAIIIERWIYYKRRSRVSRQEFMKTIRKECESGRTSNAMELCERTDTPFAKVLYAGFVVRNHSERTVLDAMEREIVIETHKLERFTPVVGTVGSTAVYIGLLGTVIGIIHAFRDISSQGIGGINVVIGGIAEALICTAAGLVVAIPAVVAYNFFIKKIDTFVSDMELAASELLELMRS